jgi:hypothetical protein
MTTKITTPRARIDQMLAQYNKLEYDAHELIDSVIDEMLLRHPNVSRGVLKQNEFTGRAGMMLNIPAALRILRERFKY